MPLSLPKSGLHICPITIPCRYVYLIKWNVNWNCFDVSLCFPIGFLSCMEILPDCVSTCIPVTHPFSKIKANGVIGEGKGKVKYWKQVTSMSKTMNNITNSCHNGNIQIISGENLIWLIDKAKPFIIVLFDVLINNVEVELRSPWICIYDS